MGCPAENERKIAPKDVKTPQRVEVDARGVWHIHGYDEGRQILRHEMTRQGGFLADQVLKTNTQGKTVLRNPPILYLEGEEHHRQRRETNKFFTPNVTDSHYRHFMTTISDELITRLKTEKRLDLSDLTMELAMKVAMEIVGLTNSLLPGINGRVEGMLNVGGKLGDRMPGLLELLWSQRFMASFLFLDVKPAIRARRKQRREDVISYLLDQNYSDMEIMTECVIYAVAGMATTREFICAALLHLMDKPHLRQRMMVGKQEERYAILHEILRLEPIIGHIYRRTTAEVTFESEGKTLTIPAGTLVDVNIYASNVDPKMAGDNSMSVCPMRPLRSETGRVPEPVLSFGDGYHRCPGAYVAIQESDIFLRKLLAIDSLCIEQKPQTHFNPIAAGYEIRKLMITVN